MRDLRISRQSKFGLWFYGLWNRVILFLQKLLTTYMTTWHHNPDYYSPNLKKYEIRGTKENLL
jgi:hypothetical protein